MVKTLASHTTTTDGLLLLSLQRPPNPPLSQIKDRVVVMLANLYAAVAKLVGRVQREAGDADDDGDCSESDADGGALSEDEERQRPRSRRRRRPPQGEPPMPTSPPPPPPPPPSGYPEGGGYQGQGGGW